MLDPSQFPYTPEQRLAIKRVGAEIKHTADIAVALGERRLEGAALEGTFDGELEPSRVREMAWEAMQEGIAEQEREHVTA